MLSERERQEIIAAVAKYLGVAISPNDPLFLAVASNEVVLGRAAAVVAGRLVRDLEHAFRARDEQLATRVSEAVNEEILRLTKGAARARRSVQRTAKRWTLGLCVLGVVEALALWLAQRGG